MITSAANKRIKNVSLLLSGTRERRKQKVFVTEGVKMFLEAPLSMVREVYVAASFAQELLEGGALLEGERLFEEGMRALYARAAQRLELLRGREDVVTETVSDTVFRKMSDTVTPQGILCVVRMPRFSFEDILQAQGAHTDHNALPDTPQAGGEACDGRGLYLILEDIQDPGNLGTMLRTAEGAGVSGVFMSRNTVDLYNPKTIRATMGSIYRVPHMYVEDMPMTFRRLQGAGVRIYAAYLAEENSYDAYDYTGATAFLIGNEGSGLKRETAACADFCLKIPMEGEVESLNAGIAAAILMYEAARQRRN